MPLPVADWPVKVEWRTRLLRQGSDNASDACTEVATAVLQGTQVDFAGRPKRQRTDVVRQYAISTGEDCLFCIQYVKSPSRRHTGVRWC